MSHVADQTTTQPDQRHYDLPEGVPPLKSLYLYIAGSCNLACRHCWIVPEFLSANGQSPGKFVKPEYIRKAVQEAKPLGLHNVKLTGGEPLLHPEFRTLVSIIHDEEVPMYIETNGTLIDPPLAEFLADNGVVFVAVSLDGATAATHDYLRNVSGSYDLALAGIKALVEVGYDTQIICTLHRGNVAEMEDVIALAESLGCGSVKFNHVQRMGRGAHFADDQGLTVGEVIDLHRRLENEIIPQAGIQVFFDIPLAFYPIRKLLDERGRCSVNNILGILSGGELSLCGIGVTMPDLIYGHVEHDALRDVWCNSPGLHVLREQIPAQLEGICKQCIHRDVCLGQCVANTFHITKTLNAAHPFCATADAQGRFPASRKR